MPSLPSVAALLLALQTSAAGPTSETVTFRLYKFLQPIGVERSFVVRGADGSTDVRTTFAFTDRSTTVPLASSLTLAPDGAPRRFATWGSTSRQSTTDVSVELEDGNARIRESGASRVEAIPELAFVGGGYAPVILTERLFRYWTDHGRPRALRLFPHGEAVIEARGTDDVTDDEGKPRKLERFVLGGRSWGRETFWIDADGRLVAFKGVDAEFDHFEAVRTGFSDALRPLVASAASDGMAALKALSSSSLAAKDDGASVAWVGGNLIDGTGAAPVKDAVVVVEGGRITAAGPRAKVTVPKGARRVDVKGKTLVPGLWDTHAHFEQVEWGPVYLAAGVTTVRDCGNELDFIRAVRDTVESGKGLGPRLLLACIVDGSGPSSLGTERLTDESGIPALIKKDREFGCSQVKIYSSLAPKLIAPLSRAAHEAGMTVTGHVPEGIGAVHAVEAGQDQINHLPFVVRALLPSEDPDARLAGAAYAKALDAFDPRSPSSKATLAFFAAHNVVVEPTLALYEMFTFGTTPEREPGVTKIAPELKATLTVEAPPPDTRAAAEKRWKAFVATLRALHDAHVTLIAGTDQAVPGHSLHREMELFVEAGFTPMEALQAATLVPARVLGRDKDLGTVEPGKIADFLVVDGDPLADIRNLRRVVTTVQSGRAYDAAALWKLVGFTP
jgi:imidazolonepropionase-like amidohydrolase